MTPSRHPIAESRRSPRLILAVAAAVFAGGFFAAPASAQVSNLDDQLFIRGLRERGMKDLILYFLDQNPTDDPLVGLEIQIEVAKLTSEDENLGVEDRAAAFDRVRPLYRDLLKKAPFSHWKRPIWATDMVQWDYETLLRARHINTADFMEFGGETGTNQKQKNLFGEVAPVDASAMDEAGLDMFALLGDLPKRKDFEQEFVNTGKWDQLQTYNDLNLPFYKAMALRYGALLPEANQKEIARVAGKTYDQLLEESDGELKRLGAKEDLPPSTKAKIYGLHGRVLVARKQADPAVQMLDKAMATGDIAPFEKLVALLAKSQALEMKKDNANALKAIEDAKKLVKDESAGIKNPINLILVYARERQLTGDDSVWGKLLGDDMIAADAGLRAAVQGYINELLIDPNAEPSAIVEKLGDDATPEKILAAADALLAQAGPHLQEAKQAKQAGNAAEEQAHMKTANEYLSPAAEILTKLSQREKLEPDQRAKAMFKLAVVEFQRGRRAEAARAWITVASEHSDQPEAETAIKYAVISSLEVYNQIDKKNAVFIKLVDDALSTLMTKYPHLPEATEKTYDYAAFLREQSRYEEAVAAYKKVPEDHPYYADAQYEMGVALSQEMTGTAVDNERLGLANEAKVALAGAERALKSAIAASQGDRAASLQRKLADTVLRQAEAAMELGQNGEASAKLRDYDKQFAKFPEMIKEARKANIKVLVNLNNIAEAVAEVKKLVQQFPGEGGPLIKDVLALLNKRKAQLDLLGKESEAQQVASDAVDLAKSLLAWAKTQPDLKDNVKYFELVVARQLVIAGNGSEALAIFDRLDKEPGGDSDPDIIFGRAEAAYMVAETEPDTAKQVELESIAMKGAGKIATLLPDPKEEKPLYWRAWALINGIRERRYERAKAEGNDDAAGKISLDIFGSIRKLELGDKDFGVQYHKDADIKATFQRLLNKHRPKAG